MIAVTLLLIRMNNIYSDLPKEIYIFVYADDIVLITVGDTLKVLCRKTGAVIRADRLITGTICKRSISSADRADDPDEGIFLLTVANLFLAETANLELPRMCRVH